MKFTKGYIESEDVCFAALPVDDDAKRIAWDILRAQEHVAVPFLLDSTVPFGEAWRWHLHGRALARWRVNPLTLDTWLNSGGDIDWRSTELLPEDFYAA